MIVKSFDTFKEIYIGGLTKEQLIQKLVLADIKFNKYSEILFENPLFSPPKKTEKVKLIKVALSDFELNNPFSLQEFTDKALASGLKLCPLYLAAFLRLEYLDQSAGPYLTIASDKLEDHQDYPKGFYLRNHENSLWLRGYQADDDLSDWPKDNEFIFMR